MTRVLVVLCTVAVLLAGCAPDRTAEIEQLKKENAALRMVVDPPPASMDRHFPPNAPAPVWHLKMFDMAESYTAIIIKAVEGDMEGALTHFTKFKSKYQELPTLVPEWAGLLPAGPIDELGAALEGGDPATIMPAVEKVAQTCHNCHVVQMPKVQAKYDWPEFASIVIMDPASGKQMTFVEVMRNLEMTFTGIGLSLHEGNRDRALEYFGGFKGAVEQLKATCETCHDSERKYYVSSDVTSMIDRLGAEVRKTPPDPEAVMALGQRIGFESCTKCHMVHVPAAFAQARMSAHE